MQKLMKRVATAERVAAKRQKTKELRLYKRDKKETMPQQVMQHRMARDEVAAAKQAIRDDWAMGPLAPRVDVGPWADARGSIGESRYASGYKLSLAQRNARCSWAGGAFRLCLAVGDRVVLLDGPDKGRIGKISHIDDRAAEVTVADLNKTNIRIMQIARTVENPGAAISLELSIPISAVRLVHPITDPTTGITEDVIINKIEARDPVTDRQTGKRRWQRVVPGLNISIPWPVKDEPEKPDYDADTLRIDVEEKTFVPSLLRPPMPEAVIDELRGRYSRFRTRHEPEYVAKLEAQEQAVKDRAKLAESMRTPLQEFHRAERDRKKRKGKPRLTLEMLEKIGEVIARSRERTLNATRAPNGNNNANNNAPLPPPSPSSSSPELPDTDVSSPPPPPTTTSAEQPPSPPPST
ncbi:hypothetical protein F4777DRAFT_549212 [Nemania sp. FL0916]|nr:hypothetical protein F4777DRAFT_549212 [Nemania sp. FL0916]